MAAEGKSASFVADDEGLAKVYESIKYKMKDGSRVPFVETLTVVSKKSVDPTIPPNHDVSRENAFMEIALEATKEGLTKLTKAGVKWQRPDDFYAEMFKPERDEKQPNIPS